MAAVGTVASGLIPAVWPGLAPFAVGHFFPRFALGAERTSHLRPQEWVAAVLNAARPPYPVATMPGLRSRFVRDLVESFEREASGDTVGETVRRVASRLSTGDVRAALRDARHADALDVADAEELLFGLDAAVGDGTGQLLERLAAEHLGRILAQGNFAVPGDLTGTVARMQAPLEHLFVGLPIGFDVSKTREGLTLFIGASGRPRTARLLSHLTAALVRACQRYAREGMSEDVTLRIESLGDRARVTARLGAVAPLASAPLLPPQPPRRRASQPHLPTTKPTLEAVNRILTRASVAPPPADPDEIVAPRSRRPVTHRTEPHPPVPAPRSDTLPSVPRSGVVSRNDEDDEPSSSSG